MKSSIMGQIVGILILFIGLIILPTYYIGIVNWRDDMNTCQNAARNFVDMVIDNQQITDKAVSDLNLELAGCNSTYVYTVYREEKATNPDGQGGFIATWNHVEITDDTVWRQGDIVTIEISQRGLNIYQRISALMLGTGYTKIDVRLSGMVR